MCLKKILVIPLWIRARKLPDPLVRAHRGFSATPIKCLQLSGVIAALQRARVFFICVVLVLVNTMEILSGSECR